MVLDAWFWAGAIICGLAGVIGVISTIFRDYPTDSTIISLAVVEVFLIVYSIHALISDVPIGGPLWEFWGYVLTAFILAPIAFFWAITDKTRWSNLVMAAVGPTVLVMLHRMQVLWYVY